MTRRVVVIADTTWAIGKIHREIMRRIPNCETVFYSSVSFDLHDFMQSVEACDVCLTTLNLYRGIVEVLKEPTAQSKLFFVTHGDGEIKSDIEYSQTFRYSVVSDVITPRMPSNLKIFVTPNGVDPSLYTHRERDGILKTVGWAGAATVAVKRFHMFDPIVSGAGLTGKTTAYHHIPAEKIDEWYQDVDILLILSGPEKFVETGPLPAFEAIVCGIPVVGTAVGNFSKIPGPKFSTVEEGIQLLEELKHDPKRVQDIAKEQYAAVMAYWSYDVLVPIWERALFGVGDGKNEFDSNA
jgi:glycosyltransferase involved in cell wall biosynthesis